MQCSADRPIKVFNYGKNQRDFTYIDDVINGVLSALSANDLDQYEIINLGNNKPVGLMDFISTLEDLSGFKAIMEMVPAQPGDAIATYACIDKASAKLGFKPSTQLHEGLNAFVKWYKDNPTLLTRLGVSGCQTLTFKSFFDKSNYSKTTLVLKHLVLVIPERWFQVKKLFNPTSVVVIGVSSDPEKPG